MRYIVHNWFNLVGSGMSETGAERIQDGGGFSVDSAGRPAQVGSGSFAYPGLAGVSFPPPPPPGAGGGFGLPAGAGHAQPAPQFEQLISFWHNQVEEIQSLGPEDWKLHQLPLARIKKIMRSDEDVKMISAEAPVLFSKACEMFILELTLRAWFQSESNRRRTLQRSDVAAAITSTDVFDFLVDIVPREAGGEELEGGRLAVPHNLAGGGAMHHPGFGPGGLYNQLGNLEAAGGELPVSRGLTLPLDPQALFQWQWAQQQAGQMGESGAMLPVSSAHEHHKQ